MKRRLALALCALLPACAKEDTAPAHAPEITTITVAGSTVLVPLTTDAAIRYMQAHPNVAIQVSAGGSRTGLSQVESGAITIGASDVAADPEQAAKLEDHRIAVVGFAVVAAKTPENQAVASLSRAQVRDVFSGKLRNWSALGGSDQAVVVINRKRSSGTRAVFGEIMLGGDNFLTGATEEDSSSTVQNLLLGRPGAISYLGLSYSHPQLKAFALDGVAPTVENIEAGSYPLWSYEHLYTHGPATGEAKAFIDFVLSAEVQKSVLPKLGFIPVAQMKIARERDHRY
jgi:phosphate transport system substrate-binding protein